MRLRYGLLLLAAALTACAQGQSSFSQVGERTYRIESEPIPGGATGPNHRLAMQLCPGGYRLINSQAMKGGPDRAKSSPDDLATTTIWVVKCI
jgi:hypothetical protein